MLTDNMTKKFMSPLEPDGNPWPKISIVTPSYNQGQFLEETIRSVLLQNYPNLEYIIMDGGSTDNSVAIIRKYESWLTYWVSEKDNGQADAIYRGFEKTKGEIIAWVNSDDLLLPNSLKTIAVYFNLNPGKDCVVGGSISIDIHNSLMTDPKGWPICNLGMPVSHHRLLYFGCGFCQPATFWRRHAFFSVDGFDRSLRFCFDYDMYLRLSKIKSFGWIREWLAAFRIHPGSKSSTLAETMHAENELLWRKYGRYDTSAQLIKYAQWLYRKTDRIIYLLMHLGIKLRLLKLQSLFSNQSDISRGTEDKNE
jgi:glycosyltransferase involved in cell wall biosynthesis